MVPAHKAKIAALVEDLDGIPLGQLERAIEDWKRTSAFLPKASDLITLAATFSQHHYNRGDTADFYNQRMDANAGGSERQDVRWVNDPDLMLMPVDQLEKVDGKWRTRRKYDGPLTPAELREVQHNLDRVNDPSLRPTLRKLASTIGLDVRV
jgi:hypothetical protein